MAASAMRVDFFDPRVNADPFPYYEEIRAAGRVVWNDVLQAWMLCGFDDCQAVFADPVRYSNAQYRDTARVWWFDAPNMVVSDPSETQPLACAAGTDVHPKCDRQVGGPGGRDRRQSARTSY